MIKFRNRSIEREKDEEERLILKFDVYYFNLNFIQQKNNKNI